MVTAIISATPISVSKSTARFQRGRSVNNRQQGSLKEMSKMAHENNPCWCECDIECTQLYCENGVDCRFKDQVSFDWKKELDSGEDSTEGSK